MALVLGRRISFDEAMTYLMSFLDDSRVDAGTERALENLAEALSAISSISLPEDIEPLLL
jgi:hypothetical protein